MEWREREAESFKVFNIFKLSMFAFRGAARQRGREQSTIIINDSFLVIIIVDRLSAVKKGNFTPLCASGRCVEDSEQSRCPLRGHPVTDLLSRST